MPIKSTIKAAACVATILFAASSASSQDVAKVSPGTTKVVFENAYIRVIRSTFPPGASEPAHTHPAGWYYVTQGGTLKVTGADGKSEDWVASTGHDEWGDGEAPHTAVNTGKAPMEYLFVEVKAAPTQHPNK